VVGGHQGRPIDGPEVRSDIDEYEVRRELLCPVDDQAPECGDDPESALLAVEAVGPLARQLVLEPGQCEVAGGQRQPVIDLPERRRRDVTDPAQQR